MSKSSVNIICYYICYSTGWLILDCSIFWMKKGMSNSRGYYQAQWHSSLVWMLETSWGRISEHYAVKSTQGIRKCTQRASDKNSNKTEAPTCLSSALLTILLCFWISDISGACPKEIPWGSVFVTQKVQIPCDQVWDFKQMPIPSSEG